MSRRAARQMFDEFDLVRDKYIATFENEDDRANAADAFRIEMKDRASKMERTAFANSPEGHARAMAWLDRGLGELAAEYNAIGQRSFEEIRAEHYGVKPRHFSITRWLLAALSLALFVFAVAR